MTRKLKTKLLKLVCKRSEVMRQPFRNSSWSNKMNQSDNKPLVSKKPGDNFWSKITNLSVGKTRSAIQKVYFKKSD